MRLVVRRMPTIRSLERWQGSAATSSPGQCDGRHDVYQAAIVLRSGEGAREAFDRTRRRLFRYDIFPPALMAFRMEPVDALKPGAVIVQSVGLGTVRLEFAVRVVDAWDREDADGADAGFTYVTLRGHPERGWETFRLVLRPDGVVRFRMEAWSAAGTTLTRLARPLARSVQLVASRAALRRVTRA